MDENTQKPQKKICPLMTGDNPGSGLIRCREHDCMFWITVYTTEHVPTCGCAHALQPQMFEGLLRV